MDIDSDWILKRVLGSGGFGIVELWRNNRTGEKIAIKKCKSGDAQLTKRQKERWVHEVNKMNQFKHQNIVGTRPLPDELKDVERSLPVLCMEYCAKGDLRSVLSKSENWCGLPESDAMQIFCDVASAINFLHFQKITHRDLKPENVVLQEWNNKVIYKLIDLGYAKELGHDSIAASTVGTLYYVAPEILWAAKYTCSVDYWSLGILFYEVITGSRPFLPNEPNLIEWRKHISCKSNNDIRVQYENGHVVYKQDIQDPIDMSPCIRNALEDWFRIVLQWDPKKRGRQCQTDGKEVVVFPMLAQILSKKVIHVFCVPHYRVYHYEVLINTTIEQLRCLIEQDTKISISSQELFDPDGDLLMDDGNIKLSSLQGRLLTLSNKESVLSEIPDPDVPYLVRKIIEAPKMAMTKYDLQRSYAAAIFFVKREAQLFRSYILALCTKIDLVNSKFDTILSKKDNIASGISLLQEEFHSVRELIENDETNDLPDTFKNEIQDLTQRLELLSQRVYALKAKCDIFLRVQNILTKLGDIEWTTEYRELLEKVQDIVEDSKTFSDKKEHRPVRMAKFVFELLECRKNLMNNEQLINIKSEIDHNSTVQVTQDLSKQEKYVESAMALIGVYREQISNLRKKWENYKQVASFPGKLESMNVECNAVDDREIGSSVQSLNEGDGLTSDHVIYDNLVIRYLMHDVISETHERFKEIINLNP